MIDYISDRIAVMCRGRLVELAPRDVLFRNPHHPYTKTLLSAVPEPDPNRRLDLTGLIDGRASEPANWPAPYTIGVNHHLELVDLGFGHDGRADPTMLASMAATSAEAAGS